VQVGSSLGRKGLDVFREIIAGIELYLNNSEFNSIVEMVGVAHE